MASPSVLVLRAPGTNCDQETDFAFQQAGAQTTLIHINRLLEEPRLVDRFQVLCIPGGFSYGDDVAAGRILANQIQHHLRDVIFEFYQADKLILGICNGFQVLLKSGILVPLDDQGPCATLTWNNSGRFEDRWVDLATSPTPCVFLRGVTSMYLPIAHAEGKFVARSSAILSQLETTGQLALRYGADPTAAPTTVLPFPINPNGSEANVAGLCDQTGRVFGLMPHPERHVDATQHPRWTRGEARQPADGLAVFRNAVQYFQ